MSSNIVDGMYMRWYNKKYGKPKSYILGRRTKHDV